MAEPDQFPWDYSYFKWQDIPREVRRQMVRDASELGRTWMYGRNWVVADVTKQGARAMYNNNWDGCRDLWKENYRRSKLIRYYTDHPITPPALSGSSTNVNTASTGRLKPTGSTAPNKNATKRGSRNESPPEASFMPQSNQDYTARRFQSFDTKNPAPAGPRYDAGYECELPPNMRSELVGPKRPRILGRKTSATVKPSESKWPLYLAAVIAVSLIGGVVWRQQDAERVRDHKAISQAVGPTPTPQPSLPTPTPGPARSWQEYFAQHPEQFPYRNAAPRATLIKLPPPRAELGHDAIRDRSASHL